MSQSDYSGIERMLHHLALGNGLIARASLDFEEMSGNSIDTISIEQPVYIAGLARSGSTILLNALYDTGFFRSLTYRDMPFVLMPGLWKKMSSSAQADREARERAHGDRIMVNYDSPEAFEEVFWRNFLGKDYITDTSVKCHTVPQSVFDNYRRYLRYIIASAPEPGQIRYLAKNNNNLLRLHSLRQGFLDASILVPFRHPAQHAHSLHRQHLHFTALHQSDAFSAKYMGWLGHYEFGREQKHYQFKDSAPAFGTDDPNYWLQNWIDAYSHALAAQDQRLIFVGYEQLGENPLAGFTALFLQLDIQADAAAAAAFYDLAPTKEVAGFDPELLSQAETLYQQLCQLHSDLLA